MRLFKDDTITIRINDILKKKFHIACSYAWVSSILITFINDYVVQYEKQYWVIPLNLNNREMYDVITKFFWVTVNKRLYKDIVLEDTINLINKTYWIEIPLSQALEFIQAYPKTKKDWSKEDFNSWKLFQDKI